MKILKFQTLQGPNYWSIQCHKLVVILLDLEDLAEKSCNQTPGFYEQLTELLPSLTRSFGACCQEERRQTQDMRLAQVVERVALALQNLAGMAVGFGQTRAIAIPGIHQVIIEYCDEQAGRYAARAAVRLCQSIVERGYYPRRELETDLRDLRELWAEATLGPSTETLVKVAEARGIPWMALSARSLIQLGYGKHQKRIQATLSDRTNILGVELADDKEGTKTILRGAGVPVPCGSIIRYLDELESAVAGVGGFPIVIKPLNGNHGRGVTLNIDSWKLAESAYDAAKDISSSVIVERYHPGRDHRVLVVNGKVIAVAERVPAHVIGDGKSPIAELIEQTNQDPQRGEGHDNVLTRIEVERTTWQLLERQGYTLDTVLPLGVACYLRATANLSTGGIAIDRTEAIHPENIWLAQRVAKIIGLDVAGIDLVTSDISRPLREVGGVVVEVNAAPGLRMHVCPSQGTPRNVAEPLLDMLFPPGIPSRIPIIAVAGSQGQTTELIAHIFRQRQHTVGYATSNGVYIDDYWVAPGGTSAQTQVLQDPTVEVAVLEIAPSEILRCGLGFSACDVGVVLDVAANGWGIDDRADDRATVAQLNSVVAGATLPSGYVVLNADQPLVATMAQRAGGQIAYFSLNPENTLVQAHTQAGGLAAIYKQGYLSILEGNLTLQIEQAAQLPLTRNGQASLIANALAASLAAFTQGVSIEAICTALTTFPVEISPTLEQVPPGEDGLPVAPLGELAAFIPVFNGHLGEAIPAQPLAVLAQGVEPILPVTENRARGTEITLNQPGQLEKIQPQEQRLERSPVEPELLKTRQQPNQDFESSSLLKKLAKPIGQGFLISVGLTAGLLMLASMGRAMLKPPDSLQHPPLQGQIVGPATRAVSAGN